MALSTGMKLFLTGAAVFGGAVAYKNYEKKRKARAISSGLTTSESCLTGIYVPGVGMSEYVAADLPPQVLATNQNVITNISAPLQKDLWNYLLYLIGVAKKTSDEATKSGIKFIAPTCDWSNIVITETSPAPFKDVWMGMNSLVTLATQNLAAKGAL